MLKDQYESIFSTKNRDNIDDEILTNLMRITLYMLK